MALDRQAPPLAWEAASVAKSWIGFVSCLDLSIHRQKQAEARWLETDGPGQCACDQRVSNDFGLAWRSGNASHAVYPPLPTPTCSGWSL
jgi:hypothetical protein